MPFDWRQFHASEDHAPAVVDPRRRLWICLAAFVAMLLLVLGRAIQLEVTQGAAFRDEALRPAEKKTVLPAPRGRILARDGTSWPAIRPIQAVAVQYRWLQDPPDERWLRPWFVRGCRKPIARTPTSWPPSGPTCLAERADAARRLAELCGLSPEQWAARARRIQARVERIAASNQQPPAVGGRRTGNGRRLLGSPPSPAAVGRTAAAANHRGRGTGLSRHGRRRAGRGRLRRSKTHPDRYPGIENRLAPRANLSRRLAGRPRARTSWPGGRKRTGRAKPTSEPPYLPDDWVGRMGVERQYEALLRGRRGVAVEQTDRSGRVVASFHAKEPVAGRDVVLTLDAACNARPKNCSKAPWNGGRSCPKQPSRPAGPSW